MLAPILPKTDHSKLHLLSPVMKKDLLSVYDTVALTSNVGAQPRP